MKNTINIKTTYLLIFALACTLFSSCMNGDWDEPDFNGAAPYGNNSLTEQNVITIAELIKKYPNVFASTDQNKQIDEDIMIKGRITGNDVGGNIYKQVTLQDNTAAIIIAINEGGLNGYLAEGSEILVDLKGALHRRLPQAARDRRALQRQQHRPHAERHLGKTLQDPRLARRLADSARQLQHNQR